VPAARVRKDIWQLGSEANPWRDPAILAYAHAVAAIKKLDTTDAKNGASWKNQAELGLWDPGHLHVTFSAIGVEDEVARRPSRSLCAGALVALMGLVMLTG